MMDNKYKIKASVTVNGYIDIEAPDKATIEHLFERVTLDIPEKMDIVLTQSGNVLFHCENVKIADQKMEIVE